MIEVEYRQVETVEIQGVKPRLDNFKENMSFNVKHNTVKEKVKSLLRRDKYSRKNDFYLCLLYWIQNGDITMNIDFKDFKKICKPETISRIRRELISEAKKGNKELKWLLNDSETLNERDNLKTLNQNYFNNLNNGYDSIWIK